MVRDSARPDSRRDAVRDFVWRFKLVGDAEPTHTLFDGGKFALPPGQEGRFWEAYGYDLQAGTPLYVTERRPPETFKLFFDVDLPADTDDARCRECCAAISAAVDECFRRPRGCIVCAVLDGAGARRGGGLHLFFDAAVTGDSTFRFQALNVTDAFGWTVSSTGIFDTSFQGRRFVGTLAADF